LVQKKIQLAEDTETWRALLSGVVSVGSLC